MFEELKKELIEAKKVYLFQLISLVLFYVFLASGNSLGQYIGVVAVNVILIAWMIINAVVIMVYTILNYIGVLYGDVPVGKNLGRTLLFKLIGFIMWFSVNTVIFLGSSGTSIPIVSIVLTLWIVAIAKKSKVSRKMLKVVGVIWFVTFFMMAYVGYPLLMATFMQLFKSEVGASLLINVLYFGMAILGYLSLIKKTETEVEEERKKQHPNNVKVKKKKKAVK